MTFDPVDTDRRLSPDPRETDLARERSEDRLADYTPAEAVSWGLYLAVGERAGTDDVSPAFAGSNARSARPALERTGRSAGVPVSEPAPRRSLRSHLELFADAVSTPSSEAVEVRRKRLPAQESGRKIDAPPTAVSTPSEEEK